jgi:hypothetical protein
MSTRCEDGADESPNSVELFVTLERLADVAGVEQSCQPLFVKLMRTILKEVEHHFPKGNSTTPKRMVQEVQQLLEAIYEKADSLRAALVLVTGQETASASAAATFIALSYAPYFRSQQPPDLVNLAVELELLSDVAKRASALARKKLQSVGRPRIIHNNSTYELFFTLFHVTNHVGRPSAILSKRCGRKPRDWCLQSTASPPSRKNSEETKAYFPGTCVPAKGCMFRALPAVAGA